MGGGTAVDADGRAGIEEAFRDGVANAAGRAGDDGEASVQVDLVHKVCWLAGASAL